MARERLARLRTRSKILESILRFSPNIAAKQAKGCAFVAQPGKLRPIVKSANCRASTSAGGFVHAAFWLNGSR
jgi:hypothetical protein